MTQVAAPPAGRLKKARMTVPAAHVGRVRPRLGGLSRSWRKPYQPRCRPEMLRRFNGYDRDRRLFPARVVRRGNV
jgi:hypothetical protein